VVSGIVTNQAPTIRVIANNGFTFATSTVATVKVGGCLPMVYTGLTAAEPCGGGSVDSHWQLTQSPDPTYVGPSAYVLTAHSQLI